MSINVHSRARSRSRWSRKAVVGVGAVALLAASMTATADEPPRSDADWSVFADAFLFFPARIARAFGLGTTYVAFLPANAAAGREQESYEDLVTRPLSALEEGTGR